MWLDLPTHSELTPEAQILLLNPVQHHKQVAGILTELQIPVGENSLNVMEMHVLTGQADKTPSIPPLRLQEMTQSKISVAINTGL